MVAARHLGASDAYRDHAQRVLGGLYRCVKFGWNQCNSFDNVSFNILHIWLENAYSRPKIEAFGDLTP